MTTYLWSALQSHPWWSLLIFALVFSFLATVYLLAYHGSGPQIDRTHNGPYRPEQIEAAMDPCRVIGHVYTSAEFDPIEGSTCLRCGFGYKPLKQHAEDSVAAYREKQRVDALRCGRCNQFHSDNAPCSAAAYRDKEVAAGRPLKGRRT